MNNVKEPVFPDVELNLNSPKGNAWHILKTVENTLKENDFSERQISFVLDDMQSSNYQHLCEVAQEYITLYRSENYEMED